MFNNHGWKAVGRDASLLYVFTFVAGFLLHGILGKMPNSPSSSDIWFRVGTSYAIATMAYVVIGVLTKEKMWKHLFEISIVLLVFSTIRNFIQFNLQMPVMNGVMLFNSLWIPFVQYSIAMTLGGTIASVIGGLRKQNGAASKKMHKSD